MTELLKSILNISTFPAILLKEKVSEQIINIIKLLDQQTGIALWQELSSPANIEVKQNLSVNDIQEIADYLDVRQPLWQIASQVILKWSRDLAYIWQELIHYPISPDDLLSATVILLPEETEVLKKLQLILDQASLLEIHGDISYAITNLYSAATIKLTQETILNTEPLININNILLVTDEIKRKNEIEEMIEHCKQYKIYLYESIRIILKKDNNISETHCFDKYNHSLSNDEIISNIYEVIKFKIISYPFNHEIHLFIKKYSLIDDMIFSLKNRNKSSLQKQIEFSEKFIQHKPTFQKNNLNQSYFNYELFNQLLGWQTKEEWFIKTAGVFSKKVQNKVEEQEMAKITL
jgi:hypothetical protein